MGRRPSSRTTKESNGNQQKNDDDRWKAHTWEIAVHVKCCIEKCLMHNLSMEEVISTLETVSKIQPTLTAIVWQILENGNLEFFRSYYTMLEAMKQAMNQRLDIGNHVVLLAPVPNAIHPMPVLSSDISYRYPVIEQPPVPAMYHPNLVSVDRIPDNFHPIQMNAESYHFHFTPLETNEMVVGAPALEAAFASEFAGAGGLQQCDSIPYFQDSDFAGLEDFGAFGECDSSPLLIDSDFLLDFPEEDNTDRRADTASVPTDGGMPANECPRRDDDEFSAGDAVKRHCIQSQYHASSPSPSASGFHVLSSAL